MNDLSEFEYISSKSYLWIFMEERGEECIVQRCELSVRKVLYKSD